MIQYIDNDVLIEDYREDFVTNSETWRQRLSITNSIIKETLEDLAPDKEFIEFSFNEYCTLCEANFRRLIQEAEIGYDPDEIITSKYYCDIMNYAKGTHDDAFRLAVENDLEEKLNKFYHSLNQENFLSSMKSKCVDYVTEEDIEILKEIWTRNK